MAKQRHLSHAPITEALIDIQVQPREGLTFASLQDTISTMDLGYYVKSPISEGLIGFKLSTDGQQPETTAASAQVGVRLHSHDEKYVAQFRLTGFTLSRLRPYDDWSGLLQETRRAWELYATQLKPVRVIRLATRFINNLQLPMQQGDSYQKYLHKLADVPDEAPQALASFFQRFQLFDVANEASVILTAALDKIPPTGATPVILDVDAFKVTNLVPTDGKLWEILEQLRTLKNRTFFGAITEKAVELYV